MRRRHDARHDTAGFTPTRRRSSSGSPRRGDRRPGLQRGAAPGRARRPTTSFPRRVLPLPGPRHRGRQCEYRRHPGRGDRAGGHHRRHRGDASLAQGARARPAHRVVDQRGIRSSPTWTSTCPPRSPPCSRSWLRFCRASATWPSAPAWPGVPTLCAAPSGSSSRGPTTCCSGSSCTAGSAMPSAASRHCGARPLYSCSRWSRTTSGSSTPSSSSRRNGSACASARCRSTGSTIPTPGYRSCAPP